MAGTKASTAAEARDQDRRKTILRAAVEVFARKGYHGCRIADVAREAGVAYGLVYHYFRNKEELLQLVFEAGWGGFLSRIRDAAETNAPLEQKIHRIAQVAFEAYRIDPRGVRVLVLEFARSPSAGEANRRTAFAEVLGVITRMFERARARGELRHGLDPALCAAMLFGSVEMSLTGFVMGLLDTRESGLLAHAQEQLTSLFLDGARAAPEDAKWKKDRSGPRLKTVKRS
ncbi:MAG TPA: TetR/AcrR family transcriptional regulator [Myxococcaceae bacterium]|nr:TetR/AcrR family transcriptional regulator [Myxococcaceae bacterium]